MKNLFTIFCLLFFCACTEDFEAVNTNPNGPTEVQPELLFRQVLYGYGNDMGREGFTGGSLLGQHFAMTDFNLFDRHELSSPQEGGDPWPILYTALRDNETVLNAARTNPTAAVYEGPALVMKAYLAMQLTDLFGDVPYFEAFNARRGEVTTPQYDAQEDIYLAPTGVLSNLRSAFISMDQYSGAIPLGGDVLFEGDLSRWQRFAWSLWLKALLRISDREDVAINLLFEEATEAVFIETNAQNAAFAFAASPPNSFPIAEVRDGIFNVFLMSETAQLVYDELDDPRRATFYRPSSGTGDFIGIRNGIVGGSSVDLATFSQPGRVWREETQNLAFNFMTAWEVDFLLAEATLRGFLPGDPTAREYYERGVRKAFEYWRTELPEDYLTEGPAAYDEDRALEQIITQKWIASTGNAYEGWTEWRRTGFPTLLPVQASLNGGQIPVRMPYPNEEQALNFENYSTAAAATDGNSINSPVWWDQ